MNETNYHVDNKQWMYTMAPTYKITDQFHVFIEEYAFLRTAQARSIILMVAFSTFCIRILYLIFHME
jgi:hypothetical protein